MNRDGGCRLFWCGLACLHLAARDQAGFSFGDPFLPDESGDRVREVLQGFLCDFVHDAAPVCRNGMSRARGVRWGGGVIRENRGGRKGGDFLALMPVQLSSQFKLALQLSRPMCTRIPNNLILWRETYASNENCSDLSYRP